MVVFYQRRTGRVGYFLVNGRDTGRSGGESESDGLFERRVKVQSLPRRSASVVGVQSSKFLSERACVDQLKLTFNLQFP